MTKVGYARVSSTGQELDSQIKALEAAGCSKVFTDKRSGVDQDRPAWRECRNYLREGDVLVAVRPDRLGRSAGHLLVTLECLKKKGVEVQFTSAPELNTDSPTGKFMLTVLAGVAELERSISKERQADGIKAAQERGVKFGRPAKITPEVIQQVRAMREGGHGIEAIKKATGLGKTKVYECLKAS
jgi:DNA invertase Pin-like site-specific DNA recombinase